MVSGEVIGAICMTEPDAGSDLKSLRTRATRTQDGWRLDGSKVFITNGQNAGLFIVAAKTDPEAGARGISLFLVEAERPGVRKGQNLKKIGMKDQGHLGKYSSRTCRSRTQTSSAPSMRASSR